MIVTTAREIPSLESPTRSQITRSRTPLRVSFCGGGTDVPPYPAQFGGCVLSSTIDKYSYVSVRAYAENTIRVVSEDIGVDATFDVDESDALTGKLDLAQAIFRRFKASGLECFMHSDAPPGSGLGSSSAMIVALITALARHGAINLTPDQVAELACTIERSDLKIAGGLQDQYACSFGGFNFIEFAGDGVHVTPLRLSEDHIAELHYHLILCYTGRTRVSSNIIAEQTHNVVTQQSAILESLSGLKAITLEMKKKLLKGHFLEFGELLDVAWNLKRTLASSITNSGIDELYEAAKSAGAVGGKILGAGGGGYFLAFAPFNKRQRVRERIETLGGRVVDFQFDNRGARSWCAPGEAWSR